MSGALAAIDCGTNSLRLLIADSAGSPLRREMRITRLGEGVDATGTLADSALKRNYDVLKQYREIMDEFKVSRAELVATSAARDATNGDQFIDRAAEITGAHVLIASGILEAELSYAGATAGLDDHENPVLIVDIGGGSTELAGRINNNLVAFSMQVGCVRVTERALGAGVVTADHLEAARRLIDQELNAAFLAAPSLEQFVAHARLVGLAGTVSTLAQLDAGLSTYSRDAVHHRLLTLEMVHDWRVRLGSLTPQQRLQLPGMVAGREDVIVAGVVILEQVMTRFECNQLLTSENDILDGIIASMVESTPR